MLNVEIISLLSMMHGTTNIKFSCECCVLSGRGLCDGLITRPEEYYRVCREASMTRRRWSSRGSYAMGGGGYERRKSLDRAATGVLISP